MANHLYVLLLHEKMASQTPKGRILFYECDSYFWSYYLYITLHRNFWAEYWTANLTVGP